MAELISKRDIAPAWAGHYCGTPALDSRDNAILAAYYDEDLRLSAAVSRDGGAFRIYKTDIQSDWNTSSHHAIAMGIDESGRVHLCAAMHAEPLKYMRSGKNYDLSALSRVDRMTGADEERVTYPQFFTDALGRLCFTFRSGESGSGDQIINVWDDSRGIWERLPKLTDGSPYPGGASAYFQKSRPVLCPDGYMRAEFMWRADARAETCFDLCCIRSRDMVNWETESGEPLTLPVTPYTEGIAADRAAQRGGLTNMCHALGFDANNKPVITYHKYTSDGKSALWCVRPGGEPVKVFTLGETWAFSGIGAIPHAIDITPVRPEGGRLVFRIMYNGSWQRAELDPDTLAPLSVKAEEVPWNNAAESGGLLTEMVKSKTERPDRSYFLRWEHGPNNRDQKPEGPVPPPRMLTLYEYDEDIVWLSEAH